MISFRKFLFLSVFLFLSFGASAQSFYRPWQSYKPVKPQKAYERIETLTPTLRQSKCFLNQTPYEPNEILTKMDINQEETFRFFKSCCAQHPSRCVSNYIGSNNKTLLYTMVEKRAYRYMRWILNEGFVFDSYIDSWGAYKTSNNIMVPLRNYTPMMLACKMGDLEAVRILRERGAYLSQPENAIGLTPYDFAIRNSGTANKVFLDYIEKEYQEETQNIQNKKQYGRSFSSNLLQDFIEEFENNFLENEQKILDKVAQINKA